MSWSKERTAQVHSRAGRTRNTGRVQVVFFFFQLDYLWHYHINEVTFKVLVLKCIRAKEIMTDMRKKKLFVLVDVLCVVVGKWVQCFNVQFHILKFINQLNSFRGNVFYKGPKRFFSVCALWQQYVTYVYVCVWARSSFSHSRSY